MRRGPLVTAAAAGVLCANSLPHLATAAAGRTMLTPLAGRDSPATVNALWGGATNLLAGLVLMRAASGRSAEAGTAREAFGIGVVAFSAWAVMGERLLGFNSAPHPDGPP
ncbi:hypothetical protein [Brachybacterium alimentarium]|uniref:hypothetical protein n=1 Tax=Brachybacterium alimentarium TaxID=47845 RepID=UPI000DF25AF4|nr:hypothetical protein [Brachybacterium alimentarium]RCS81264.1 hypothetical protein CIK67_15900 [Brachybacterium alimentarium]